VALRYNIYNIDIGFLDQTFIRSVTAAHVSDEGNAVLVTLGRKRVGVYNLRRGEVVSAGQELLHAHLWTKHIYQEIRLVSPATKVSVTLLHHR
jgi:hypothetical protein